jgi:hypothetical protein
MPIYRDTPYPTQYPTNEAGVTLRVDKNTPMWFASYVDRKTGVFTLRRFSCRRHGYDGAYTQAVKERYRGIGKRPPTDICAPPIPPDIRRLLATPVMYGPKKRA